ncbi:hypothetical protein QQS21_009143 [Conoideocrella luteorostrata]|uniref:Uncharacterized protein n=1 Tax=Conoideocrella luteorostrata TaxID=1105319 RepID=A0AAJ0FQJ8_9HYPO|nr:hypothetical protein QQS21_009143 [Conoideocrella luteorostrata]
MLHAEHVVSEAAHMLAIRGECNETAPLFASAADAVTALGFTGSITASRIVTDSSQMATTGSTELLTESVGESVPVSTQTALSTIYSIKSTTQPQTITTTTTGTTTITLLPVPEYTGASDDTCQVAVTKTVLVTVYPPPPPPDATVTAGLSTVTNVNTQVSYTSGLPDVTLSGNPSTYTTVQTQVSLTSGAPDATVSGNPSTATDVHTDLSLTTSLPEGTVSGDASTVTDIQVSWSWPLTTTYSTPFTTLTVSDLWGPASSDTPSKTEQVELSTFTTIISSQVTITISHLSPSFTTLVEASSEVAGDVTSLPASRTSTFTQVITVTGPPAIETTTVDVPPPAYTTTSPTSNIAGDVASTTSSTSVFTPVVISDGSKRPEPKAWGGSNGSRNVACTIMLIATIMFML